MGGEGEKSRRGMSRACRPFLGSRLLFVFVFCVIPGYSGLVYYLYELTPR
jgi:hypothetical protein